METFTKISATEVRISTPKELVVTSDSLSKTLTALLGERATVTIEKTNRVAEYDKALSDLDDMILKVNIRITSVTSTLKK